MSLAPKVMLRFLRVGKHSVEGKAPSPVTVGTEKTLITEVDPIQTTIISIKDWEGYLYVKNTGDTNPVTVELYSVVGDIEIKESDSTLDPGEATYFVISKPVKYRLYAKASADTTDIAVATRIVMYTG